MPVWEAQNRGYVSVGLHVDSEDWQRPGVPTIVNNVLTRISERSGHLQDQSDPQCSRNIVLLHDSGGDRSQTVAALPILIDTLRARGYRFVPVSELAGLSPDQAMPPLSSSDRLAARTDLAVFELLSFASRRSDSCSRRRSRWASAERSCSPALRFCRPGRKRERGARKSIRRRSSAC